MKLRKLKATLSISDIPEVLAAMRREMAMMLRREANEPDISSEAIGSTASAEATYTVKRVLAAIADAFEAGVTRTPREGKSDGSDDVSCNRL